MRWMDFETLIKYRDSMCMHQLLNHPHAPESVKGHIKLRSDVSTRRTRAPANGGSLLTVRCRLSGKKSSGSNITRVELTRLTLYSQI